MRPEVARDALLATHGGLSLAWCAVIWNISPMALYRLICAFGHQSLVTVLTRCGLPLPLYVLADEKHSTCLADKVYLPTIVRGRVLWHLGSTTEASAAAFTQSYQAFQRAAVDQVACLLAADIVSRLPSCRLSDDHQPVIMTRNRFSTFRSSPFPFSTRTPAAPFHAPQLASCFRLSAAEATAVPGSTAPL